jgi:uncharacterized protein with HEPN domain
MRLEEKSLLYDVRTACELIARFTAGKNYAEYATDDACRSAVERQFIIVGEALNRLGKLNPELLGRIQGRRAIISFRNILVHGYDRVEDEVVWGIVKKHVPILYDTVSQLLDEP